MSIEINPLEASTILLRVVLGRTLHALFAWVKKKTYKENGLD